MLREFLKKSPRLLSIDFGQSAVKALLVEVLPEGIRLLRYQVLPIQQDSADRQGAIAESLADFLKAQGISEKNTILSISDRDSVITRYLTFPPLPEHELLEAVRLQLKDEVHFSLSDAIIQRQLVREHIDEEGAKKKDFLFFVAERKAVDDLLAVVQRCGLKPLKLTTDLFNYANLLEGAKDSSTYLAVLDIGYRYSALGIYQGSQLCLTRRLSFCGEKLTQSLTGVLFSDQGRIALTLAQAEEIKIKYGIPAEAEGILDSKISASQALSLMRPLLEGLLRDLRLSFDYLRNNFNGALVQELYLSGAGAGLKNLDRYLSSGLGVKVSSLALPAKVEVTSLDKDKLDSDAKRILSALGAALGRQTGINLLPQEVKTQKARIIEHSSLRVLAVALSGLFLLIFSLVSFRMADYQKRLKNAKAHLSALEGIRGLSEQIELREELIQKVQNNAIPLDGALKAISSFIPANIVLEELSLDWPGRVLMLKGMVLAGENVSESLLTDFSRKLQASPYVLDASVISVEQSGTGQRFVIKCDLVS